MSERTESMASDGTTHLPGEAIAIHASRTKHVMLALPCFYVMIIGIQVLWGGAAPDTLNVGLIVIGALCGGVMLYLGFETKPIVVIDENGIFCRRPDTGLIPWSAITGLGMGRAPMARTVLLIALDETAVPPEELTRLRRDRVSSLMHPETLGFQGDMAGHPTIQISIAFLAIRPSELRRILDEKVRYYRPED